MSSSLPVPPSRAILRGAGVVVLFSLLTVVFTWPQAAHLSTDVIAHYDPLFSVWRLAWIAHQLVTDPANLFEGNFYYPAHRTLAYSDAMLLPGLIGLPLIHLGVPAILVMNLLSLLAMATSGAGMYLLARRLTGSTGAGIVAGIIFAFAPYRAAHLHHLELQWAQWMPLAFWALHRAMTDGRLRDGVFTGLFVTAQLLSSIYYAIFLGLTMALVGGAMLIAYRRTLTFRSLAGLTIGALIVIGVAGPYSQPYARNIQQVGLRDTDEIRVHSAQAASYLAVTRDNYLYGNLTGSWSPGEETVLFPGIVAIVLLALALIPPIGLNRWLYLLALAFAVQMSFGWNGALYRLLYTLLPPLHGLRAPGRFGILVLLALGVLAAFGAARLEQLMPRRLRLLAPVLLGALLLAEYAVAGPAFDRYPTRTPDVYRWLARQPPALTLELPLPTERTMPLFDAEYMYFSTMHWQTLVNGYSGNYPRSYLTLLHVMETFPDDRSIADLQARGVDVLILHRTLYERERMDYNGLIQRLQERPEVQFVAAWSDSAGEARAYRLFRGTPVAKP
jgi:hypothetical protein